MWTLTRRHSWGAGLSEVLASRIGQCVGHGIRPFVSRILSVVGYPGWASRGKLKVPSPDSPRTGHCWGSRNVEKSGVEIRGNSEPGAVDIHRCFHESATRRLVGGLKRVHQWNETGVMIGPAPKLLDDSHGGQGRIGGGGEEWRRGGGNGGKNRLGNPMATGWGHETSP